MWNMHSSKMVSKMAQDVLCNRNTPIEIRVRTTVVVLHETISWDMPAVIPSKQI
jgi:hypothetical protein